MESSPPVDEHSPVVEAAKTTQSLGWGIFWTAKEDSSRVHTVIGPRFSQDCHGHNSELSAVFEMDIACQGYGYKQNNELFLQNCEFHL